jgi:NADPH2:quinone reductase
VRAAVCRSLGPPEVVAVEEVPPPSLGPGQVRVRIAAAAVNFADVLLVAGTYQVPAATPFVPGSELAGTVVAVAADVPHLVPGDRVTGTTLTGAFAEEISMAADAVGPTPVGMSDVEAAAGGVAHRTAHHVLRSVADVQPHDELVVLGAGGGVGLAAVQLGVALGASVTAVASSREKLDVAAAHGARHLVRPGEQGLREALRELLPAGADVVVDPVGGPLAEPALRSLAWGGRFVTVGYASGEIPRIPLNLVLLKGVEVHGFQFADFVRHRPADAARNDAELRRLFEAGTIRPHIGATYSLDDVVAALRHVADRRAIGKVVLDLSRTGR